MTDKVEEKEVTEIVGTEMLSMDEFLTQDAINLEPIVLDKLPGFPEHKTISIKPLTQSEREILDEAIWANVKTDTRTGQTQVKSLRGYKSRAIHLSVVKEDGSRMFTEQQAARLSSKVINYIFETIEEISGLKMDALDDAAKK